ncbi:ABC transporter substrate-binding protein [Clostridium estertheticum]|uniref:ABC transporter substrate-binding protein n=1 Tax=Clostridium estertheticum TaxID=238834 RepID=UPI001C7D087F|nr:extracellular solute-binding protein [Clostridium estertheticum]MBX4267875.1 extracellular solute-binding protein [Clostridium estertheticum]WLC78108.1 extracellular solute-binding protein [Clostridium estertheticum]
MFKLKKLLCISLSFVFITGLVGCGKSTTTSTSTSVNIKFFSNLPDKATGQGKLEQTLIDSYVKIHPNVKVTVEALQDDAYKQKFTTYAASNQIPDLFMVWGQPSFLKPIMTNGYVAELNANDFKDYGFLKGSLDGFSSNGKLYGLPRNTDFMVLYYNKALFKKYNVKLPTTYEDIVEAAKTFRKNDISPISMNGKDKYTMAILYQELLLKESGDQKLMTVALKDTTKLTTNPLFVKAANDVKGFQNSFVTADYGAANNLFAQGKAAMYYMGSWEVGMDKNKEFSDDFKKNVDVMKFPVTSTGKGKDTDLVAWNGGGYAVSAKSKVKDESIKLLKYMMKPENWAKLGWRSGAVVPAQKYDQYLTGKESNLQKKLTQILSGATSISGVAWDDALTPDFKTNSETLSQEFFAGIKTPKQFLDEVAKAVISANK